jgi:hypothetical protein
MSQQMRDNPSTARHIDASLSRRRKIFRAAKVCQVVTACRAAGFS